MKIVVAPDKFKGSLPATQVAAAIAAGLHAGRPGAEIVTIPVADGGEGTIDAQSLAGKTPVGVARAAARRGVGVIAVAGRSTLREPELAAAGIAAVYALSDLEPDLERCRAEAARLLRRIGQMIARERLAEVVTGA
jgi:glycerate kinase